MSEVQDAWIERVLGVRLAASRTGYVVRLASAMIEWNQMRVTVGQELRRLQEAILDAHEGEDDFDEIEDNVTVIDDVLAALDDRLIDKLDDLRGARDDIEKAKIAQEARRVLDGCRAYLASDPLINDIDDNGYVPLAIRPLIASTLERVAAAI